MAGRGRGRESTLPAWMTQGKTRTFEGKTDYMQQWSLVCFPTGAGGPGPGAPGSMPGPGQQVRIRKAHACKVFEAPLTSGCVQGPLSPQARPGGIPGYAPPTGMTSYVPPAQQQPPRFSQPQQFPGHPQARPGPLPSMPVPQQRPTLSQYPSMSGPGMPMQQQLQQLQAPRPAQQMQSMPTGVPAGMYGAQGQPMPRPQVPHWSGN